MTLETTFYVLGIIYIVGSLLVLIGMTVAIIVLVYKVRRLKDEVEAKIKAELNPERISNSVVRSVYPLLVSGAVSWATKVVNQKLKDREKE